MRLSVIIACSCFVAVGCGGQYQPYDESQDTGGFAGAGGSGGAGGTGSTGGTGATGGTGGTAMTGGYGGGGYGGGGYGGGGYGGGGYGGGGYGGGGYGGAPACSVTTGGLLPACDACINSACLDTCTVCENDIGPPSCVDCVMQAATSGCAYNDVYQGFRTCVEKACLAPCTGTGGGGGAGGAGGSGQGICDTGLTTNDPPCDICLGDKCCPELNTCINEQLCMNCITGQTTTGCDTDSATVATTACLNNCVSECGG